MFTLVVKAKFLNSGYLLEEVKEVLTDRHKSIPLPDMFRPRNLFELYTDILSIKNDSLKTFKIWRYIVALKIYYAFKNFDKDHYIDLGFDFDLNGTDNESDIQAIHEITKLIGFDWIFINHSHLKKDLDIIYKFTDSKVIIEEFLVFYPRRPKDLNIELYHYWDGELLNLINSIKEINDIFINEVMPLVNHSLITLPKPLIPLTDPILYLWLNQKLTDQYSFLYPRDIEQIVGSNNQRNTQDYKLFIAWFG